MSTQLQVPVSPEQKEVILDHLFFNGELGMLASERGWLRAQVEKVKPGARILSADLDIEAACWNVEVAPGCNA